VNVRVEKREEYLRLHTEVWPEVESRLAASHISNYSIFILGDLLIAYFEYIGDDFERDVALIAADPATQRWWTMTDPCQIPITSADPGTLWSDAEEVWHLG
jgi:L-rhamnose mutarotase